MARQQKNNPGLIFADRNLHPDEGDYADDNDDDETYHDDDDDNPDDDNDDDDDDDNPNDDNDDNDEPYHHNNNHGDDDDDDDDESYRPNDNSDDDDDDDYDGDEGGVDTNDDDDSDGTGNDPPTVDTPDDDTPEDDGVEDNETLTEDVPPQNDAVEWPEHPPGEIPGVDAFEHREEQGTDHARADDEPMLGIPQVGGNEENEDDVGVDEQSETPPEAKESSASGYGLRNRRGSSYSHRYAGEDFVAGDDTGIILATRGDDEVLETPQMSLKAGLQTFGDDGIKAVEKEMRQLHDRDVMKPVHKCCLTPEQQKEALAYLMFLKRKRYGKIKGHGCTDGRKQRAYITKEESTVPTVITKAVFLTAVIDAMERQSVVVLDVPGAFMQAKIDELVHVRFSGVMVTLLLEIDHEMYKDYVVVEKGERVMYMELLKALYGTLRATRLFW